MNFLIFLKRRILNTYTKQNKVLSVYNFDSFLTSDFGRIKALEGNFRKEHLFALQQAYEAYEFFHNQINICEKEINN